MKRLATYLIEMSVFILFLQLTDAYSGRYHIGDSLICNDCHVNHYSLQHEYDKNIPINLGAEGPYIDLLKDSINDLCLSCHNDSTALDVLGENRGNAVVRQAGALNHIGDTVLNYPNYTGHSLGSVASAPGSDINWSNPQGLNCVDCHDPHGSLIYYRNLRDNPGNAHNVYLTYAVGINDLKNAWVFERTSVSSPFVYDTSQVDFNEPEPSSSKYAEWCQGCHNEFHGGKGSTNMGGVNGVGWVRHPSADADIGAIGNQHSSLALFSEKNNRVKVMDPDGNWSSLDGNETPSCFSCHKAHGNKNPFGLIYMSGSGQITEEGDTSGRGIIDLCNQCHVQGIY